jgi:hypothetical protein
VTERAPYELGEVLHGLVARHLIENLKGTPSAEMLGCARSFLRDQGIAGQAQTDKDRKQLRRLLRLYIEALHMALTEGEPSGAVLAEVGRFLHRTGIVSDLGGHVEAVKAMQQFTAADLPFAH